MESLQEPFEVGTCYGTDERNSLKTQTWAEYLSTLRRFQVLTRTERIVLNVRYGVGFDTGTSYVVELRYPVEADKVAPYL